MRAPGIIRPARRPTGWRAPGPAPARPSTARAALGPHAGEDLCHLAGEWRILQRVDGHRWSLDDLVTAWFAASRVSETPPTTVLDLGCGIGAVLMLLAWRFPEARLVGVEAQALSVELARRSLAWNGAAGRARIVAGDLREPALFPAGTSFALVTGTPPYLRPGAATPSRHVQRGPCRITYRGGIEDYCLAAARWMAPEGCFVACEAAAQRKRVGRAAASAGLTIERRCDVVPRAGKAPLFSVYAMRRAGAKREPVTETRLVVRDAAGERTPAFRALRAEMGMPP